MFFSSASSRQPVTNILPNSQRLAIININAANPAVAGRTPKVVAIE